MSFINNSEDEEYDNAPSRIEYRKRLIEKKIALQYSKNILKLLDGRGIDIVEIYENNENIWLPIDRHKQSECNNGSRL